MNRGMQNRRQYCIVGFSTYPPTDPNPVIAIAMSASRNILQLVALNGIRTDFLDCCISCLLLIFRQAPLVSCIIANQCGWMMACHNTSSPPPPPSNSPSAVSQGCDWMIRMGQNPCSVGSSSKNHSFWVEGSVFAHTRTGVANTAVTRIRGN